MGVKNQNNSIGESWEFRSIMNSTLTHKLMLSVKDKWSRERLNFVTYVHTRTNLELEMQEYGNPT